MTEERVPLRRCLSDPIQEATDAPDRAETPA